VYILVVVTVILNYVAVLWISFSYYHNFGYYLMVYTKGI